MPKKKISRYTNEETFPIAESVPAAETTSAKSTSDFTYTESDGEVTITGLKDRKMKGKVVIPSTINGSPVTSIGDEAFCKSSNLTSLTLPASVTSIGVKAFLGCGNLTIRAPKGSAAEKYAIEKRIKFETTASSSR